MTRKEQTTVTSRWCKYPGDAHEAVWHSENENVFHSSGPESVLLPFSQLASGRWNTHFHSACCAWLIATKPHLLLWCCLNPQDLQFEDCHSLHGSTGPVPLGVCVALPALFPYVLGPRCGQLLVRAESLLCFLLPMPTQGFLSLHFSLFPSFSNIVFQLED